MRVIAGTAKGRRLVGPRGRDTRPFMDRVKEALFSSLGQRVRHARVLDLYAGSGSLGLEALSRGAESAVFVEWDEAALAALEANIDAVGLGGQVVRSDVMAYLDAASEREGDYDLVFVDPPYDAPLASVEAVLAGLVGMLGDGARVVLHRRAGGPAAAFPAGLRLVDRRRYGDAELWLYEECE